MGRISKEELQKKHVMELQVQANNRYRQKNNLKKLNVEINGDKLNALSAKLVKVGITKKQFVENAIDKFLEDQNGY